MLAERAVARRDVTIRGHQGEILLTVLSSAGLWAAGVQAELHVWAGGFHGFEGVAPGVTVTEALTHARDNRMRRMLA